MSGREPPSRAMSDATLDRLLGKLPAPEVPADLALRIVANATALPQQKPREAIMAIVPPSLQPPRARPSVGARAGGVLALAAAACVALILIPQIGRPPADQPIAARTAEARPVQPAQIEQPQVRMAEAIQPTALQPAHVRKAAPEAQAEEQASPDTLIPVAQAVQQEVALAQASPTSTPVPPDLPRTAQVAGPKAPVQGPPTPIDIIIANSRSSQGLGVVGGIGPVGGMPGQR